MGWFALVGIFGLFFWEQEEDLGFLGICLSFWMIVCLVGFGWFFTFLDLFCCDLDVVLRWFLYFAFLSRVVWCVGCFWCWWLELFTVGIQIDLPHGCLFCFSLLVAPKVGSRSSSFTSKMEKSPEILRA